MTIEEAIAVLEEFNMWRRGEIVNNNYTPKEIGEAIDLATKSLKLLYTYE